MSRPLRLELAGGLYHITSRGDRQEAIYHCDSDRKSWLELFGEVARDFTWRCHAWCQMTNHYHLVIETAEPNLSQGMRQLNGVYTQRINRRYNKVGHVFQGRYKAILVDRESHLLELSRYVVLNPVRAGMTKRPDEWRWSSLRAMLGFEVAPVWMETDWILRHFGDEQAEARMRYLDFVQCGIELPSIWDGLRHQIYLGSDDFMQKMQRRLGETAVMLKEIPRLQRRNPVPPLEQFLRQSDRAQGMALAYASGAYTKAEIARAFGVHYSTVSRLVKAKRDSRQSAS